MKNGFNIDSPVWRAMGYIGDLIQLNLLFLLTSLPIFTIGASVSAMASVHFGILENRGGVVRKDYFKAFKENFKASTVIWLFYLAAMILCGMNFNAINHLGLSNAVMIKVMLGVVMFLLTMTMMYSLAMQARFKNDLKDTIVKGFMISLSGLPYTIVMLLMMAAACIVCLRNWGSILYSAPFWILIGFSLLGLACNIMYLRVFKKVTFQEDLPDESLVKERDKIKYRDGDRARDKKRREMKTEAQSH